MLQNFSFSLSESLGLRRLLVLAALLWTAFIGVFLFLQIRHVQESVLEIAAIQARNTLDRDLVYRRWAAEQGGIYVPVTEQVPPNPYLQDIPERDLLTPSGRRLTLVNPAYMTRQVYELERRTNPQGIQGHITSLQPLRPENAADDWEMRGLLALVAEAPERTQYQAVDVVDGVRVLRLIRPMLTEERCLKCHAKQGYQVGDLRGALSATVPLAPLEQTSRTNIALLVSGLGLTWLLGLGGIGWGGTSLLRRTREKEISEQALRRSETTFRALIDNAGDAILIYASDRRLREVNDEAVRRFGYSRTELLTMAVDALIVAEEQENTPTRVATLTDVGLALYETTHVARDGRRIPTEVSVRLVEVDGLQMVVATCRDITERRRSQAERERLLGELEVKNRELEGLLYTASHDLRSPLVNVHGFSQRIERFCRQLDELFASDAGLEELREQARPLVHEKIPLALGYVCSSVTKMDGLIDGLLRLSRAGRQQLSLGRIDMNRLLTELVKGLQFQLQEAGATVQIEPLPDGWGDPTQLGQIFTNLIDNALKYRSPERPLRVRVCGQEEATRCLYTVSDNGLGLAPEVRDKIWELFYRVDPAVGPAGEGLGLTLVQRIVGRHGGQVWVESQPDEGSIFYVALPKGPTTLHMEP